MDQLNPPGPFESILDDIKACGTEVLNNGTHFIYSNAVQGSIGMSNSVISRTRHVKVRMQHVPVTFNFTDHQLVLTLFKLDYECAFQNSFILTYGSAINTQLTTIDVSIDSGQFSFFRLLR